MSYRATAAVIREPEGPFSLEEVDLSALQEREALVRIEACGICYTDNKFRSVLPLPAVLGHEGVGIVEEIGRGVTRVAPGDRVIISYPWCAHCPACLRDEPYCCENIPQLKFSGARADGSHPISLHGTPITSAFFQQSSFATRAIALEHALVKVHTDLPSELLAALPCGVQTGAGAIMNTFGLGSGNGLAVFGAGTVGLSAIMASVVAGATPRIAIDLVPARLELARELGATHVIDAREGDVVRRVKLIAPRGLSHVLETSATMSALEQAIECAGQGGKVGIVSAPPPGQTHPFSTRALFQRVASLHGIVQGHSIPGKFLPSLIGLQTRGVFPFERLVSTYDFADINRAFADTAQGAVVKPVLRMRAAAG